MKRIPLKLHVFFGGVLVGALISSFIWGAAMIILFAGR